MNRTDRDFFEAFEGPAPYRRPRDLRDPYADRSPGFEIHICRRCSWRIPVYPDQPTPPCPRCECPPAPTGRVFDAFCTNCAKPIKVGADQLRDEHGLGVDQKDPNDGGEGVVWLVVAGLLCGFSLGIIIGHFFFHPHT